MQLDIIWEPGKHIWHSYEGDVIVHVIGYLGLGKDGKHYMKVAESTAGVPLNELTHKKEKK